MFQEQYRGELLELEILPFKETPFAAFFEAPDPVAERLPVIELVERVAERWAKPTNGQLKARLLVAAAFQRAFVKARKALGDHAAINITNRFQEVYCFLTNLNNQGSGSDGIVHLLQDTPPPQLVLRYSCEWLFVEEAWRTLPQEIAGLLKT